MKPDFVTDTTYFVHTWLWFLDVRSLSREFPHYGLVILVISKPSAAPINSNMWIVNKYSNTGEIPERHIPRYKILQNFKTDYVDWLHITTLYVVHSGVATRRIVD